MRVENRQRDHRAHRAVQPDEQDDRHDDVGEQNAEDAESERDDEQKAEDDGAERQAEVDCREQARAFLNPQQRERQHEKRRQEDIDDEQPVRPDELERVEERAVDRPGQRQQQRREAPLASAKNPAIVPASVLRSSAGCS